VGAPAEELSSLQMASMPVLPLVDAVEPDVLIEDGTKPEVPGWDLLAIWTPGHSPGHLCFHEPRYQLMLSGDHVLPRITPNIAFHPQAGADPLGDFLASLDRVATFPTDEVLPAHEHRFVGLPERVAELRAHHEQLRRGRRCRRAGGHLGVGHRLPDDLVPAVGPDRRLHAAGGRGRGHGPSAGAPDQGRPA
jgi:glyoxylase-like metal-dependent hydrolase (beta-lactamase superfamily II)